MYSIEILCPDSSLWVDHLGNDIDRLVLSKKYEPDYIHGHYPLQSFGTLERTISDIPERPIQSLTDWNVSVNSVYSSKDGSFSTIDLFYFLEAKNEEKEEPGYEFNLVGCKTHLYDDGAPVFSGVVNSVETSNGTTSINISEQIGSPSIARDSIPTVLGNAAADALYWPVEITKDDLGAEQIILSKEPLQRFDGLFIYDEENNRYIECEFEHYEISSNNTRIVFCYDDSVAQLSKGVSDNGGFFVQAHVISKLRTDSTAADPENYVVGTGSNAEMVQAWNNQVAFIPEGIHGPNDENLTILDRGLSYSGRSHGSGEPFRRIDSSTSGYFYITLVDEPISVTETGDVIENSQTFQNETVYRDKDHPLIYGSPGAFIRNSKEGDTRGQLGVAAALPPIDIPTLTAKLIWLIPLGIQYISYYARFTLKFPKMNLSSEATISKYQAQISLASKFWEADIQYQIGDKDLFTSIDYKKSDGRSNFYSSDDLQSLNYDPSMSYSDTEIAHIHVKLYYGFKMAGTPSLAPSASINALRIHRRIKIPFNKAKLFAKGQPFPIAANTGDFIIPAVNSLLAAAAVLKYTVAADGELPNIEYGTLIKNETAEFRDKLGDLAAASSTLIRFSPISDTFLVKSTRKEDATVVHIPRRAILEENNIFNFKMQTPKRTDVYTEIEIAWGKNIATGKYENKILANKLGVYHNDIFSEPIDSELGWGGMKKQLIKSSSGGKANKKIIENEWIRNREGAEYMAYNYLRWTCVPLRRAEVKCIRPWLPAEIDLGSFVSLDLPGYPPKLADTAWIVTSITDNLDDCTTGIELLEAWKIPVVPLERFLATENWDYIATEQEENKIQLER